MGGWSRVIPTLLIAFVLYAAAAGVPTWVVVVVITAGLGVSALLAREEQTRRLEEPHPDRDLELVMRGREACEQAGMTGPRVEVVTGEGLAYLNLRGRTLLLSPEAGELLSDGELTAMVVSLAGRPAGYVWRAFLEPLWPWGAAGLAGMVAGVLLMQPWLLFPGLAVFVGSRVVGDVRPAGITRLLRAHFQAFLARGGRPADYLSAYTKLRFQVIGHAAMPVVRARMAGRTWAELQVLAGLAGIGTEELRAIVAGAGAPELAEPVPLTFWQRLGPLPYLVVGAAVWLVLLTLTVYIAVKLMSMARG